MMRLKQTAKGPISVAQVTDHRPRGKTLPYIAMR